MKKRLNFNMSASCLDLALDCPYLWSKIYIEKVKFVDQVTAPLLIGSSFHNTVEKFYKKKQYQEDLSTSWVESNVTSFLYEEYQKNKKNLEPGIDLEFCKYKVRKQASNWRELVEKEGWVKDPVNLGGKIGAEIYFKFPYEGHPKFDFFCSGRIDLLALDKDSKLCIIDWKTGKWQEEAETSIQIIFYSAAIYKLFQLEEDRNCLVYVEDGIVKEAGTRREADYIILKDKIESALNYIEKDNFPLGAEIGKCTHCRWCPETSCKYNKA